MHNTTTAHARRVLKFAEMGILASRENAELAIAELRNAGLGPEQARTAHLVLEYVAGGIMPAQATCTAAVGELVH